jgi:hypothetical protein
MKPPGIPERRRCYTRKSMSRRQQLLARLLIAYREIVDIAPAEAFDRSAFVAKMCSVTRCPRRPNWC